MNINVKTIIVTISVIFVLSTNLIFAQKAIIPVVFDYPVIGFDIIQNQNPLLIIETVDAINGWMPSMKLQRKIDQELDVIIADEIYTWINNSWQILISNTDSVISDNNGNIIEVYRNNIFVVDSFRQHQFTRFMINFNSENKVESYLMSIADTTTTSGWTDLGKIFIFYNNDLRVMDSIFNYSTSKSYLNYYYYDSLDRVVEIYENSEVDSLVKTFYRYISDGIVSITRFELREFQSRKWEFMHLDSFSYDNGNIVGSYYFSRYISGAIDTIKKNRELNISYDIYGNITQIIENDFEGNESSKIKTVFEYNELNNLVLGLAYYYDTVIDEWIDTASYRYITPYTLGISSKLRAILLNKYYPNPATDVLNIEIAKPNADYVILDITGRKVMEGKIESEKYRVDLGVLNTGIYFLNVYTTEGQSTQKFSVAR